MNNNQSRANQIYHYKDRWGFVDYEIFLSYRNISLLITNTVLPNFTYGIKIKRLRSYFKRIRLIEKYDNSKIYVYENNIRYDFDTEEEMKKHFLMKKLAGI